MIEAGLHFPPSSRRSAVEALMTLPIELRPTDVRIGEDQAGTIIKNSHDFIDTASVNKTGFILRNGNNVSYTVSFSGTKNFKCSCFLKAEVSYVKILMRHMASARPIFGYACAPEELKSRNRIERRIGKNLIEAWVGRDPTKAVPGLYWLTLLPADLAARHGVPLPVLEAMALAHEEVVAGQHLFQFCASPQDWRAIEAPSLPGVFDIEKVKPLLKGAKTWLELLEMLKPWP